MRVKNDTMRRISWIVNGLTSPSQATGVSAFVHASVLGALATWSLTAVDPTAEFRGDPLVVHASWSSAASVDAPPPPPVEASAEPTSVVITPRQAQVAQRILTDTPTAAVPEIELLPIETPDAVARPVASVAATQRVEVDETPPEPAPESRTAPSLERTPRPQRPPSSASAASAPPPVALGTKPDLGPSFENNQPPRYPDQARINGWQGTVLLELDVDVQGQVVAVRVIESSGYAVLDAAAANAVKNWKGRPAMRRGEPLPTTERLPVRFRL